MKIKFLLEYTDSPFWSEDEESRKLFGNNIELKELNLSKSAMVRLNSIMNLYYSKLNPVYQGLPSLWSGRMNLFFQMFLKQVYSELKLELENKFELTNYEQKLMDNEIDVEQVDKNLTEFMNDPSEYADKNGINYKSKLEFNNKIRLAKEQAEKLEFEWTTI